MRSIRAAASFDTDGHGQVNKYCWSSDLQALWKIDPAPIAKLRRARNKLPEERTLVTPQQNDSAIETGDGLALELALEQSQHVKAKVEACADDLGSVNAIVKEKIAAGETKVSARTALATSERVEGKVQECAEELHEVNEILTQGIADIKHTEDALAEARSELGEVQIALATARAEEEQAKVRALHDATTGLPNRLLFNDRLEHAIAIADRHSWTLALMFLDLDGFKSVNDTHGHEVGDRVLKEIAGRLMRHCRQEDSVCRNGGDEFLYLLINPQGRDNVERIANDLLANVARPMTVDAVQVLTTTSIGIAMYPEDGTSAKQLVANADSAMYRAKHGRQGYLFSIGLR